MEYECHFMLRDGFVKTMNLCLEKLDRVFYLRKFNSDFAIHTLETNPPSISMHKDIEFRLECKIYAHRKNIAYFIEQ